MNPRYFTFASACSALLGLSAISFQFSMENSSAAETPLTQTAEVDQELRRLDETPIGRQIAEIEKKFSAATEQVAKARDDFQEEFFKLQKTEAYRNYQKRRQALEDKRETEWSRERKTMAEAARKLYSARHAELAMVALK